MLYDTLIGPFVEFAFMRRALVGTIALALGAGPVGVFLMLRRMSLVGDAMAHAILPGAAIGFLVSGLSLFAMTAGGLIAGFVIALGAGVVARATELKEDASLAAFFLISLAVGVTIVSMKGNNVDLLHFLFGSVLALDDVGLDDDFFDLGGDSLAAIELVAAIDEQFGIDMPPSALLESPWSTAFSTSGWSIIGKIALPSISRSTSISERRRAPNRARSISR